MNHFWIAPSAHRMLCVSRSVARALAQEGVPPRKIEVAENGVRLQGLATREEARSRLGLNGSELVVGAVAALRPEKAHELLLEAVASCAPTNRPVRLCLVGSGPRAGVS